MDSKLCCLNKGISLWRRLLDAGVKPAGLGARDTLRLEAGLNLYGQDMNEKTKPAESNLVDYSLGSIGSSFIGRAAIEKLGRDSNMKLTGLVMRRNQYLVKAESFDGGRGGVITSGTFSPTFNWHWISEIPKMAKGDCQVEIREKRNQH